MELTGRQGRAAGAFAAVCCQRPPAGAVRASPHNPEIRVGAGACGSYDIA